MQEMNFRPTNITCSQNLNILFGSITINLNHSDDKHTHVYIGE